jgi:23S rRNA (uracil1939-C5)-methyltransferase
MIDLAARLAISRLGQRGEGVGLHEGAAVYVPYALPGDRIVAEVDGARGKLAEIVTPSADRIAPFCPYFTACGGCAVQTLAAAPYAAWKRELVVAALTHAGVVAEVAPLVDAHGAGRRRATFHVRFSGGAVELGFMRARSHELVEIAACPITVPALREGMPALRAIATALAPAGKPLDILATATPDGLDVDVHGHGPLDPAARERLIAAAADDRIARVANHGTLVAARRAPRLGIGAAQVALPPGAFLQATEAGEDALATRVVAGLAGAKKVADLFAGLGTFALRLAASAQVHAVDLVPAPLAALAAAAGATAALRPVTTETRDLFRRPLTAAELNAFDGVVFDPPRAGAPAQAEALAAATVPRVVAVSCNAQSFARDAAILMAGGYSLESVTPIDQFRHAPHVEIVALFRRPVRKRPRGGLLG